MSEKTWRIKKIRCEDCGNEDPKRFHRTYVEESRERLVDGEWVIEEAWEFSGGSETHAFCDACGSSAVEHTTAAEDRPPRVAEVARTVGNAVKFYAPSLDVVGDDDECDRGFLRFRHPGKGFFHASIVSEVDAQP